MASTVAAFDLGTGGVKAALFRADGSCIADRVSTYRTHYPSSSRHEQRPRDWWNAIVESTHALLAEPGVERDSIRAISISGHSLGCIPLSKDGEVLQEFVPIWSDGRADKQAERFFERTDQTAWYLKTGNGFPAPLYTVFKAMWLRDEAPDAFARTSAIIGTKDYVNYRLTGRIATDPSYASGTGVYDLHARCYDPDLIAAAGLDPGLFPDIVASTDVLGELLPDIADELGLPQGVMAVAGGVDNSCMALGARTFMEGDLYSAMGSSSWLTVSSAKPLLDDRVRPFAFAHVVPGMCISATSIFSAGTSVNWVRDTLLSDLVAAAKADGADIHDALFSLATQSPPGARGLIFVPTLGGGTSFEGGPAVRGGFIGLDLQHGKADILRASLEGVAFGLRAALDELRAMTTVGDEMIMVGGGARSPVWRRIFADIFGCTILKTGIDQQAAALGAAALAFVGLGVWDDFAPIRKLHVVEESTAPSDTTRPVYAAALAAYRAAASQQRAMSSPLQTLRELSR